MLIRGDRLNDRQRRQVLAAFVHRWTFENARHTYRGECPACVQRHQCDPTASMVVDGKPWHEYHNPIVSDGAWLADHAFHFNKDGSRLMATRNSAEPAYMADA